MYLEKTMEDINEVLLTSLTNFMFLLFLFYFQKSLVNVNVADCKSPCKYNYTYGHDEISVLMSPYALDNYIDGCFCSYSKSNGNFGKKIQILKLFFNVLLRYFVRVNEATQARKIVDSPTPIWSVLENPCQIYFRIFT